MTLLEVLVALSIFSLAALALLRVAGQSVNSAAAVETAMVAQVLAENHAAEAVLALTPPPLEVTRGTEAAAGREWNWERSVYATSDPQLLRVVIRVEEARSRRVAADLSVFRSAK